MTSRPSAGDLESIKRRLSKVPVWAWLLIVPAGTVTMCCGGCTMIGMMGALSPPSGRTTVNRAENHTEAPLIVSASQLFADYKANEVSADLKYKGRSLEIDGVVGSIGKDLLDTIYVTLGSGGQFEFLNVQCYFDDKYMKEAAELSPGQRITVRGRCDGKFGNVLIKNCEFVPRN